MSDSHVLLQYGDDPFNNTFDDLEGRRAFSITSAGHLPNAVYRLTREPAWSQRHPSIMGPGKSYFYFGPDIAKVARAYQAPAEPSSFFISSWIFGGADTAFRRSRYFTSQAGKDYKWRISPSRMELFDSRTILAVWELSHPDDEYHARLIIRPPGLPVVTEIVTTLAMNRMAQQLRWGP
ncbi:hypothetical protein C0989_006895 [Termitomyces sp. Mn162]|nr:hypothetical protein C0989_006895 [Termitomyces sp. Mn162]